MKESTQSCFTYNFFCVKAHFIKLDCYLFLNDIFADIQLLDWINNIPVHNKIPQVTSVQQENVPTSFNLEDSCHIIAAVLDDLFGVV